MQPAKNWFCLNLCHHSDADFQLLRDNRNSERGGVNSLSFAKCSSNDVQEVDKVCWEGHSGVPGVPEVSQLSQGISVCVTVSMMEKNF